MVLIHFRVNHATVASMTHFMVSFIFVCITWVFFLFRIRIFHTNLVNSGSPLLNAALTIFNRFFLQLLRRFNPAVDAQEDEDNVGDKGPAQDVDPD